jgi:competence protein ComEA
VRTTPQERLALGVVALLLVLGAGFRWARPEPAPAAWSAAADTAAPSARAQAAVEREARAGRPLGAGERLDPNRADAAELERLPRVGPALAGRIVARRESRGPFRTLADLDSVPGIGPALLAALAPHLTLPPAPAARAPAVARAPAGGEVAGGTVDLNTARAEELERLPGIGPALARRLVEWRERNGPFRSVEAVAEVPGVGEKTVRRMAPLVRVSP